MMATCRRGYRPLHILMRRDGIRINRKKTQRLYREQGLTMRRRKGRKCAVGARAPASVLRCQTALELDFVDDQRQAYGRNRPSQRTNRLRLVNRTVSINEALARQSACYATLSALLGWAVASSQ